MNSYLCSNIISKKYIEELEDLRQNDEEVSALYTSLCMAERKTNIVTMSQCDMYQCNVSKKIFRTLEEVWAKYFKSLPIQVHHGPFTTKIEKIVENKFSQLNDLCILSDCEAKLRVVMEFDSE